MARKPHISCWAVYQPDIRSNPYVPGRYSLGGLIAVDLVERFPDQYDGALALCGVVGGAPLQFQHEGDGRVLFDYFFSGVLPGDLFAHTEPRVLSWQSNLHSRGKCPLHWLGDARPTHFAICQFAGLPGSLRRNCVFGITLVGDSLGFNELLQRTHGHNFYDNTGTVYSGSADDIAMNTGVQRFSATPAGYIAKYYTPTDTSAYQCLRSYHAGSDRIVFQEHAYADAVAAAGASQFLVQQFVTRYGHCNLKPEEYWAHFRISFSG